MLSADDVHVVIPSRRRVPDAKHCVTLWPTDRVSVCVEESEAPDYAEVSAPIVTHPRTKGLGELRQWILDHYPQRVIVMCNDDVKALMALVGKRPRAITDPQSVFQVVFNAATIADDLGLTCFSFSPTQDLRKFNPQDPFRFTRLEGALWGFVGRRLRFDPHVAQHDDLAMSLEACLQERIVWMDSRFGCAHNFQTKGGGNSEIRGKEQSERELQYLKNKYGPYLGWTMRQSVVSVAVGVPRRQFLEV